MRYAVLLRSKNAVNLLLHYGDSASRRTPNGETPIFTALDSGIVQLLIAHGADPNAQDNEGNTVMHRAVCCESDVLDALLAAGATLDIRNADGDQPINVLLRQYPVAIPELPEIARASNLNTPGKNGLNAIQQTLEDGNPDIRRLVLPSKLNTDGFTSFLVTVSMNDGRQVRRDLARNPAYAWERLPDGSTALKIAAIWAADKSAYVLLGAGPNGKLAIELPLARKVNSRTRPPAQH